MSEDENAPAVVTDAASAGATARNLPGAEPGTRVAGIGSDEAAPNAAQHVAAAPEWATMAGGAPPGAGSVGSPIAAGGVRVADRQQAAVAPGVEDDEIDGGEAGYE